MSKRYGKRYRRHFRVNTGRFARFLVLVAVIILGVMALQRVFALREVENTFARGVSVDGIDLWGYTYNGARETLQQRTQEQLDQEIRLTYQNKSWTFTIGDIAREVQIDSVLQRAWQYGREGNWFERYDQLAALHSQPVSFWLLLEHNDGAFDEFVRRVKAEVDVPPVDSKPEFFDDGRVEFTDSADGYEVDAQALKEALIAAVESGQYGDIALNPLTVRPKFAKADIEGTIVERFTYNTQIMSASDSNRTKNIIVAMSRLNGTRIDVGEKFSLNTFLGKRTLEAGYLEAPEYLNNETVMGIGGGVCQVSSTLYGALLKAGISPKDIQERHPHSSMVDYVIPGFDAMIDYGRKDLIFTNNTDAPIYIYTHVDIRSGHKRAYVRILGAPMEYIVQFFPDLLKPLYAKPDYSNNGKLPEGMVWRQVDPGKVGGVYKAYLKYFTEDGTLLKEEYLGQDTYKARAEKFEPAKR